MKESKPLVGSSAKITDGLFNNSLATQRRFLSPPEIDLLSQLITSKRFGIILDENACQNPSAVVLPSFCVYTDKLRDKRHTFVQKFTLVRFRVDPL